MKISYIKLPNEILNINLTANELAVLFYLSSIYASGCDTVCVKQSTIAEKCGIKTTQTISKITASLSDKGLIVCRRCIYDNNSTGMIYYTLKLAAASTGYFSVQRQILNEHLTPVQLRAYLYICRSLSPALGRCWNSYNDLAKLIGTSRSKVIEIVAQLTKKNVIRKHKIKTRSNKRVYGDNHYTVVRYVPHSSIRRRCKHSGSSRINKKVGLPFSPFSKSNPTGQSANLSYISFSCAYNNTTKLSLCQLSSLKFFMPFFEKERSKKNIIHNDATTKKTKSQSIWRKML